MYAPVRAFVPPGIRLLLDGQGRAVTVTNLTHAYRLKPLAYSVASRLSPGCVAQKKSAMKPVHLIARAFALVSLFTILSPVSFRPPNANLPPGHAHAQESSGIVHYPNRERSWDRIPAIMISTKENDPRIRLVHDAVEFWNKTFAELGAAFRLGPVAETSETLPAQFLATMSDAVLSRKPLPDPPETLRAMKGDLIVALSDGDLISFSTGFTKGGRVIVGIRSDRLPPLTLPNVARNVIAHELGHAIGLGHNNDPAKLMCGRPAPCRPDAFRSKVEKYFPLTEVEKVYLLKIYPPGWMPSR